MKFDSEALGIFDGEKFYVAGLILLASFVYFCSGIFFGIDFTDSFFHLNQARDPANETLLLPFFLSTILLKLIMYFVGQDLIILRLVHSLFLVSSVFIPFIILKPKISMTRMLVICSLVLILFAPLNFNILSYDSFSIGMIALIFATFLLYWKERNLFQLVFLSFLIALAVLLRLPNVLLVPFIFLFLLMRKPSGAHKDPYIFLLFVCLVLFGGYLIYYNNVDMLSNSAVSFSLNEFKSMMVRYFRDAFTLGIITACLSALYLAFHYLRKKDRNGLLAYAFVIIILSCFTWWFILFRNYSHYYSLLLTSFCLTYIIINVKRNQKMGKLVLLLFLTFILLYPLGSNTGLLKSGMVFLLFPFVYCVSNSGTSKYWHLVLVLIIPFSVLEKMYGTYEEQPILELTTKIDLPKLNPIRTSDERYSFLKEVDHAVHSFQQKGIPVFFYGNKSHIFHYLYPGSDLNLKSFYQPVNNLSLYEEIDEVLRGKEKFVLFLIDTYPGEDEGEGKSLMGEWLEELGYHRVSSNSLVYYLK